MIKLFDLNDRALCVKVFLGASGWEVATQRVNIISALLECKMFYLIRGVIATLVTLYISGKKLNK